MENLNEKLLLDADIGYHFSNGKWSVGCTYKKFRLNNNGMKLLAMNDEGLKELHFDCENKTVTAVITQSSTRWEKDPPRKADLSDDPQFFEDLRENIEEILLKGKYDSVTPNEDRTIFKIS